MFPINGTETFFIPKERIAILIYNTNYDEGPEIPKNSKGEERLGNYPKVLSDDYKKMYMILLKL
jgi:hypothetical protein